MYFDVFLHDFTKSLLYGQKGGIVKKCKDFDSKRESRGEVSE